MDATSSAITYALLVIPTFFAFAVIVQGIQKAVKQQEDGPIAIGIGFFLLLLIGLAYWLFIR
jgi:hypothetical protein